MSGPASAYNDATKAVAEAVAGLPPAEAQRKLYMLARAAALQIRAGIGAEKAAEKIYALGDELATGGGA